MKYQYWLSANSTNARIGKLLENGITARDAFGMSQEALEKIPGLTPEDALWIRMSRERWNVDARFEELQEKGIRFVCREDSAFPGRLEGIHNPPYAIYYIGELPDPGQPAVAMVGARGRSIYGSEIASKLSLALGQQRIQVISGMALGIDTDSHAGCMEGGGRTFAVLGCGVDVVYPRQNRYLYEKIIKHGGVLSEFPPGTPAKATHFPQRNRIISGLSDKVIVVEARLKSGSLITADLAMEQGKDVYAVPGRITDPLSQGTNRLIRQGAGAIISVEDFMKELQISVEENPVQMDFYKNLLEKDEFMVYSVLDFDPLGLGALLDRTNMQLYELLEVLGRLQSKGFAKEPVPNYYIRTM